MPIQDLILQAQPPNLLGNLTQGLATGAQLGQINEQRQRRQTLNDLLGQGATPEQLTQGGFLEEGKLLAETRKLTGESTGIDPEFLKEQRKVGGEIVKNVNKRAGEIRTAFGKVKGLHKSAKTDRQAAAGMIMNVARLISPGVVTDTDFQVLSGAANPVAAALAMLTGRDEKIGQALSSYYDPTNPQNFDADALLNVAKNVTTAEAGTLFDQFDDAKQRGITAGLNERQLSTIFGEGKNLAGLRSLVEQPPGTQEIDIGEEIFEFKSGAGRAQKKVTELTDDDIAGMTSEERQELIQALEKHAK